VKPLNADRICKCQLHQFSSPVSRLQKQWCHFFLPFSISILTQDLVNYTIRHVENQANKARIYLEKIIKFLLLCSLTGFFVVLVGTKTTIFHSIGLEQGVRFPGMSLIFLTASLVLIFLFLLWWDWLILTKCCVMPGTVLCSLHWYLNFHSNWWESFISIPVLGRNEMSSEVSLLPWAAQW
jgi:hypothetical protein